MFLLPFREFLLFKFFEAFLIFKELVQVPMLNLLTFLSGMHVGGEFAFFYLFLVFFLFEHLDLLPLFVFKVCDFRGNVIGGEFGLVG